MSKSIRHDPRPKLPEKQRQRLQAMDHELLRMSPDEAAQWVESNVKTLPQVKALVVDLVKAVNALAHEVRRPK